MDYNEIMGKAERLQLVLSTLDPDLFDKLYALYLEVRGNEGVDADTRGVALVHLATLCGVVSHTDMITQYIPQVVEEGETEKAIPRFCVECGALGSLVVRKWQERNLWPSDKLFVCDQCGHRDIHTINLHLGYIKGMQ